MPTATNAQIQELANTVALQADALAQGKIDQSALYPHIRLMAQNVRTLEAWTADLKPQPISQNRVRAHEAVRAVEAAGGIYIPGSITANLPALDEDLNDH